MNKPYQTAALTRLIDSVEMAILANGGSAFQASACDCDTDTGYYPCRYCAIWGALKDTLAYLKMQAALADVQPSRKGLHDMLDIACDRCKEGESVAAHFVQVCAEDKK